MPLLMRARRAGCVSARVARVPCAAQARRAREAAHVLHFAQGSNRPAAGAHLREASERKLGALLVGHEHGDALAGLGLVSERNLRAGEPGSDRPGGGGLAGALQRRIARAKRPALRSTHGATGRRLRTL